MFCTPRVSVMDMLKTFMILTVISCLGDCSSVRVYRQERAEFSYCNAKYIINCKAYTARIRRGASYTTNLTSTTIKPFDKNCLVSIMYHVQSVPLPLGLTLNMCEVFKRKWSTDFIRNFSNVTRLCPVPPGTYLFKNVVLPPKDFPLPIPVGKNTVNISFFVADTNELMMTFMFILHVT